jgi:hypothetical protein
MRPIMTREQERFMCFEGSLPWTQAIVRQAEWLTALDIESRTSWEGRPEYFRSEIKRPGWPPCTDLGVCNERRDHRVADHLEAAFPRRQIQRRWLSRTSRHQGIAAGFQADRPARRVQDVNSLSRV